MKANHLTSSSVLNVGQKLIIPGKAPAGAPPAGGGAAAAAAGNVYTVKPGDTLAAIAHASRQHHRRAEAAQQPARAIMCRLARN